MTTNQIAYQKMLLEAGLESQRIAETARHNRYVEYQTEKEFLRKKFETEQNLLMDRERLGYESFASKMRAFKDYSSAMSSLISTSMSVGSFTSGLFKGGK